MKITFLLPAYTRSPVGGCLMVYEYANRLTERGHRVTVLHETNVSMKDGLSRCVKNWLKLSYDRVRRQLPPWFKLDPSVDFRVVPKLSAKYVPDGDVVVATWWATANSVAQLPSSKGAKAYYIQHHEIFHDPEEIVHATYSLPLKIIVIAPFLEKIVKEECPSADVTLIPNSIDVSVFKPTAPIETRKPVVGMLWSRHVSKGVEYGLEALNVAKAAVPELEAILFGGGRVRPIELPDWIEFVGSTPNYEMPNVYNRCSMFLHSSVSEGWGLPPAEAMACGCCLIAAANEGVTTFAFEDRNALLAPIMDGQALGKALIAAAKDDNLRIRLAKQAVEDMQALSWSVGTDRFERVLKEAADKTTR